MGFLADLLLPSAALDFEASSDVAGMDLFDNTNREWRGTQSVFP